MRLNGDHPQREPIMDKPGGSIRMEIVEWKIERLLREVEKRRVAESRLNTRIRALEKLLILQGQFIKELQGGA